MVAIVAMPAVLTSCGDDETKTIETPNPEPKDDEFENLYGYWINSDYSGAMEILENNSTTCKIIYFVYTSEGLKSNVSLYNGYTSFMALTPDGKYNVEVEVLSSSLNKLVLEDHYPSFQETLLSSYVFSRVNESNFYKYLEGGENGGDNNEQEDDAKKLIGTWVGYDGTPGLESTDKYTLSFYSSGKAKEVYSWDNSTESMSGTYKYSDGKITEWEMEEGSILMNTLGECPWIVTFVTSTKITIGDKYYSITFTKQ